jgi:IclR family acetate operon transcriptional repressor
VTPIHAGASAKALLAFLEEPIIDEVLAHELEPLAPGTVTDPAALREQLDEIRARGWASSYEENNVGAWGLAAPILVGGRVVASIGFAAPTARHSDSTVRSLAKLVCEAARESEARLDSANMAGGAGS